MIRWGIPRAVLQAAGMLMIWIWLAGSALAGSPMDEGIAEFNAGHYDKAVTLFGEAEPTNFNDPVFHYYLGSALVKVNAKPDAIKQFKLALDLEPTGKVADYCKKALENLSDKKTKGGHDRDHLNGTGGQTPQVFAVECGCPLCDRLNVILADVHRLYGDRVQITRFEPLENHRAYLTAEQAKNQAIVDRYNVSQCPTVLFFGDDGQLANQMSGVITDADMWRQVRAITEHAQGPAAVDPKVLDMRTTIMREAEAKVADSKREEEDELQHLKTRADQDISDLSGYRGRAYGIQQIEMDLNRRTNQIRADFEKRQQQIMDEANNRINSIGH